VDGGPSGDLDMGRDLPSRGEPHGWGGTQMADYSVVSERRRALTDTVLDYRGRPAGVAAYGTRTETTPSRLIDAFALIRKAMTQDTRFAVARTRSEGDLDGE